MEELPGANTQAGTLDEARENLKEAVHLVLEANRALSEEEFTRSRRYSRAPPNPGRVKRRDLLKHLEESGCELLRKGGKHTIYVNRGAEKSATIPRHREINDFLARKICPDLDVPQP